MPPPPTHTHTQLPAALQRETTRLADPALEASGAGLAAIGEADEVEEDMDNGFGSDGDAGGPTRKNSRRERIPVESGGWNDSINRVTVESNRFAPGGGEGKGCGSVASVSD